MLSRRPNDDNTQGIDFMFMTVRNWGENPSGTWTLEVSDTGTSNGGMVHQWSLRLLGTESSGKMME